jgi:hypothetical protein
VGSPAQVSRRELLGIVTDRPKHPQMAVEATRIASYTAWPTGKHQTPQQLAKAGFFYAGRFLWCFLVCLFGFFLLFFFFLKIVKCIFSVNIDFPARNIGINLNQTCKFTSISHSLIHEVSILNLEFILIFSYFTFRMESPDNVCVLLLLLLWKRYNDC